MEKVYPSISELTKILKNLSCPEVGCVGIFQSKSNLNLHLAKKHKQSHFLQGKGERAYYCPISNCCYHKSSFFKQFKLLKQHFLKVHSEKFFNCVLCNKGFPTKASCDSHVEYCNVTFKCCNCDAAYGCYETLKTHARRKHHKILEKISYKTDGLIKISSTNNNKMYSVKGRFILPKPVNIFAIQENKTMEQSSQTDLVSQKETLLTISPRKPQLTVETQTINNYFDKKSDFEDANKKSIRTQTNSVTSKSTSCNTSFNLNDFEFTMSSSTQTNCNSDGFDFITNSTVTSDLIDNFDSSFFNCHMETQTDFMFNEDLFNCDDYSNMYTQTCENLLMSVIGLNTTQTQTMFDDFLRSVESQTVMSHSIKMNNQKASSHTETQTDLEFKQMLEEINT